VDKQERPQSSNELYFVLTMRNAQAANRIVQIEELNNTEDATVRKTALWKRMHIIDRCPNVQKVREIVCKLRQQDNAYGKPRKIIITAFMPLTVAIYAPPSGVEIWMEQVVAIAHIVFATHQEGHYQKLSSQVFLVDPALHDLHRDS
jgi:hypothetical protein